MGSLLAKLGRKMVESEELISLNLPRPERRYNDGVTSSSNPAAWLFDALGIVRSDTGVVVNEFSAMNLVVVAAAVRVIAESVAALPLHLYERMSPRGKRIATEDPLYYVLHTRPNRYMSSLVWRETMQAHLCLWGNAYCLISWNSKGVPELWPILPHTVNPKVDPDGNLRYHVQRQDGMVKYLPQDVLHIPGLSYDGLRGYSPVALWRQAAGLGLAAEKFGAKLFANGGALSGVLEHPGKLGDEGASRLKASWTAAHAGLDNAHKVAVLEEGMKWVSTSIPPEDAQFLQTRKFQVEEIARAFRIPPHMLGALDRATFSNIEQQGREFINYTLTPWLTRWEQELDEKLLSAQEQRTMFFQHDHDALEKATLAERGKYYATGRQWGWLTPNDIADREDMNPIDPAKGGDDYWRPVNEVPTDDPVGQDPPPEQPIAPEPEGKPKKDGTEE